MIQALTILLPDGQSLSWSLDFSGQGTLRLSREAKSQFPKWTRLSFFQCPECELSADTHPTCPVAEVLARFARDIGDRNSVERVNVLVEEDDRREIRIRGVPLQQVVGELVRLAVFQSGCPIGRKLKPAMARLRPFPTRDEIVQAFAIFFALQQCGRTAGRAEAAERQRDFMQSLHNVFGFLSKRLEQAGRGDAYINGIVIIDSLSLLFSLSAPELVRKAIEESRFW